MWSSILKFTCFIVLLSLLFTGTTDADMIVSKEIPQNEWAATTLDFSGRDTASGSQTNMLFNVTGIRPGGFQIKAIRVQKDGKMNFDYKLTTELGGGDQTLCANLNLTILENWQKKYEGKLKDLSITRKMEESGQNDWILQVSLNTNEDNLKNKTCDFKFVFSSEGKGFGDQESIENQISSGTW